MPLRFAIIVPTLNPGQGWASWIESLKQQSLQPDNVLIIDSSSDDGSPDLSKENGFLVHSIKKNAFNHGGTRQKGFEFMQEMDIIVFLTQDAVFSHHDSLKNLLKAFQDPEIGAAFGRQLPNVGASSIEAHARLFNYPNSSRVINNTDIKELGIKAAFISNSFAGYRSKALFQIGGFPKKTIVSEDNIVAARMLLLGWKIAYQANSSVFHSHTYSPAEEFRRYFDIGVFHSQESWFLTEFGEPENEGFRFIRSEISYLKQKNVFLIPCAFLRTFSKYLGYRLGRIQNLLPIPIKRFFSSQKTYWN